MFLITRDVSPLPNTTEPPEELVKLENSDLPTEDGPKNPLKLYCNYSKTLFPMPKLKDSIPIKWLLRKLKSIKLCKEEEELSELTEESMVNIIFLISAYLSSNCHVEIVCEEVRERVKREKVENKVAKVTNAKVHVRGAVAKAIRNKKYVQVGGKQ